MVNGDLDRDLDSLVDGVWDLDVLGHVHGHLTLDGVGHLDGDLDVLGVHGRADGHLHLLVDGDLSGLVSGLHESVSGSIGASMSESESVSGSSSLSMSVTESSAVVSSQRHGASVSAGHVTVASVQDGSLMGDIDVSVGDIDVSSLDHVSSGMGGSVDDRIGVSGAGELGGVVLDSSSRRSSQTHGGGVVLVSGVAGSGMEVGEVSSCHEGHRQGKNLLETGHSGLINRDTSVWAHNNCSGFTQREALIEVIQSGCVCDC